VTNVTRETLLADHAGLADTVAKRNIGLLRHTRLAPGDGLLIPTQAVHTFGMKFPIDVIFLSRKKRVLKIRPNMVRRRVSISLRAHWVLELPAGKLAETGTLVGDQLVFDRYGD
jgi:uncharacterized membrane protein (UPF0127 family)